MAILPCLLALLAMDAVAQEPARPRVVLITLDGLRPDYVTPERMPHLHALGQRGVVFTKHHSVFPTVTRVNATSLVTGVYPQSHGILENTIYIPEAGTDKAIDTSNRDALMKADAALDGKLITAETLGETLARQGKKLAVFSDGSTGSAWLLNHHVNNGAIVHTGYAMPESLAPRVAELVGAAPEEAMPNASQHGWVVDAFLKVGIDALRADCAILWLSDPDGTAHETGIGSPETLAALACVDAQVQRVVDGLDERGLLDSTNIFIVSDHGFSTFEMPADAASPLGAFMKSREFNSAQIVRAATALYLRDEAAPLLTELASTLAASPGTGTLFSHAATPGNPLGAVPGTLSFSLIRWAHPRAGNLLAPPDWSDAVNTFGFAGATTSPGVAGHGSSSPWDIHNTLMAFGPGLKSGVEDSVPSGNVDLAPTLCRLLGVEAAPAVEGRVLEEALVSGPDPSTVDVFVQSTRKETNLPGGGAYRLEWQESYLPNAHYLDFTRVTRAAP